MDILFYAKERDLDWERVDVLRDLRGGLCHLALFPGRVRLNSKHGYKNFAYSIVDIF